MSGKLRLLAQDEEDLTIVSAHLEGAHLRLSEMVYLPKQKRFALVVRRCDWQGPSVLEGEAKQPCMETGLHFDSVLSVRTQNIEADDASEHVLLALGFIPSKDGAGAIDLLLADGGRIRLDVECIEASLRDLDPAQ